MLELRNITKLYKTKGEEIFALKDVSLTFEETGMVFIIGKSGSGKTTLLNVIGGLDSFNEGELIIKGKSFADFKQRDFDNYRNTFVGFIFQEYNLLNDMTVEKNISLAMELQGQRKKNVTAINDVLEQVDLKGLNKRTPQVLSGGQKQRVAIARAIVKNPQIILADEPTGALDTNSGIHVMNILKNLSREHLVIVVSHNTQLARAYADRIIEISDGQIENDYTLDRNVGDNSEYIRESGESIVVKSGVKLSEKDVKHLQDAIESKKKVKIVDDNDFFIESKTVAKVKEYGPDDAKFIKGRLGFANTMKMGLSTLKTKPLRLIMTILLCAIAFSIFGMFDSMIIGDDARLTRSTLKNSNVPSVVLTTTYKEQNGDESNFNISQTLVDDLASGTGMPFKGAYNIYTARPDEVRAISSISKYYLTGKLSGVIEVKDQNELSRLGLKLLCGKLPTEYDEIALPYYYAMCIINYGYQSANLTINEQNCKNIKPEDLVKTDNPVILTMDKVAYKIVGIINTGTIDKKYDTVLSDYDKAADSLKNEFENYIVNSYNLYGVVKDGFVDNLLIAKGTPLQYKNTSYTYDFDLIENDEQYFYSYGDIEKIANSKLFIDEKDTELEGNGVLVNIQLFDTVYSSLIERFKSIAKNSNDNDKIIILDEYLADIKNVNKTADEKFTAAREAMDLMCSPGYNIRQNDLKIKTTATKKDITRYNSDGSDFLDVELANKTYTLAGFYTGLAKNADVNALVLTDSGMTNLGINVKQGPYNAVIAPSTKSNAQIDKIVELVTRQNGLKYACSNNVITIVTINRGSLQEISNLFLIASAVFAVFAVAMMANYISTSIVNRRTQIGILRALGSTSIGVLLMFLVESLIIAIINIALSNVITAIACSFLNRYLANVININIPLATYTLRQFWVIGGVSLAVALLSSLAPILNLSRKKPIETITKA